MTPKRVALLLIAGVLVIAGSLWMSAQRHLDRATLTGDPVLPGLDKAVNAITEIRISKGDGTRATLKKGTSDWMVVERNYPADSGHVRKLLLDLGNLKVVEEKTHSPARYAELGVEDADSPKAMSTMIELVAPSQTYRLLVGKSDQGEEVFVRVPHHEASLLAHPLVTVDADPRHWIDRTMIDIADKRIKDASIEPAAGPAYTATREAAQQDFKVAPLPKGRELSSSSAANELAGALSSLQADDVRAAPATPAPPANPPPAAKNSNPATPVASKPDHAIFHTFDNLELNVTGTVESDHHYLAIVARSTSKDAQAEADTINQRMKGWQFEIPSYKYQPLFRPLEELLKKVEPPKAKTGKATPEKATTD
jgi:hypothetical protein